MESAKVITTLRKTNIQKIQKIQLMRQYFKDYKSKMKEEELAQSKISVNFETQKSSNGLFLKKKQAENTINSNSNEFFFNFQNDKLENFEKLSIS